MYCKILADSHPGWELYLAVPQDAYYSVFSEPLGQFIITREILPLLLCDQFAEVLVQRRPSHATENLFNALSRDMRRFRQCPARCGSRPFLIQRRTTMPSCIQVGMACDALRAKSSILILSMVKFGSSTTALSMGWPVNWKN